MFQPFYNQFNNEEVKVQKNTWTDDYDTILQSEINYHRVDLKFLQKQQWEQIIKTRNFSQYRLRDLSMSLFTINSLTHDQILDLSFVFTKIEESDIDSTEYAEFKKLRRYRNPDVEDRINRDIGRTYRTTPFFSEEQNKQYLKDLLLVYSAQDPEVGYSQGTNFIMGSLIYMFAHQTRNGARQYPLNEVQKFNIFRLFRWIMYEKEWRMLFIDGTPGLFQTLAKFQFKLKKKLPQLAKHLREAGIVDLGVCFTHHIMTVLLQKAPIDLAPVLLNMFLIEGERITHKFVLAALQHYEQKILQMGDFLELTTFIRKDMLQSFYDDLQIKRNQQMMLPMLIQLGLVKVLPQTERKITFKKIIISPYTAIKSLIAK